jgi:thiopurine S-methyltransferase
MKADFWFERWKNNQIGFHQRIVNALLQTQWAKLDVPAQAKVFVPLCGKSRDMLWLREQGHNIFGVESVQIALRDFFLENRLTPRVSVQPPFECWEAAGMSLWCGDFFDLTAVDLEDAGAVYDRASLIAFPADMRRRYVDKMIEILPRGAKTLLITLTYPEGEMNGPPFSVTDAEVRDLYADYFHIDRLVVQDALSTNARLGAIGLTQLSEQAYRIRRRDTN